MLATQYTVSLPADYDMAVIRRRVADRGHLLDNLPGLRLKAYLVQDIAAGGRQNLYAPFYVWDETVAAADFFWGGGGFAGIVRDFGRPSVATWIVAGFRLGRAAGRSPSSATLQRRAIPVDEDPMLEAGRLGADLGDAGPDAALHSVTTAIDPRSWEAVVFTLCSHLDDGQATPVDANGQQFEVLHLSRPRIRTRDVSTSAEGSAPDQGRQLQEAGRG